MAEAATGTRPASKRPPPLVKLFRFLRSSIWAPLLTLIVLGVIAAGIILLLPVIIRNLGYGLTIAIPEAIMLFLIVMVWPRMLVRRWNLWLAIIAWGFALWGMLAFFNAEQGSLKEATLGGYFGLQIIGAQNVMGSLRVVAIGLVGFTILTPRLALALYKDAGIGTVQGAKFLAARFSKWSVRAAHRVRHFNPKRASQSARDLGEKLIGDFIHDEPDEVAKAKAPAPESAVRVAEKPPEAPVADVTVVTPEGEYADDVPVVPEASGEAVKSTDYKGWKLPRPEILDPAPEETYSEAENLERARRIEEALESYGIDGKVVQINPGPAVTQFGVEPGWSRRFKEIKLRDPSGKLKLDKRGKPMTQQEEISKIRIKVDKIASLDKDLALVLAAPSIRIESPVPGKSIIGIEVPNVKSQVVTIRAVLETAAFRKVKAKSKLAIALGKGSGGESIAADLAGMPHLLIAGATGSGKSVCINAIAVCLLMHTTPSELRMIMVDPKRVELTPYNSVPHLLTPVIVDVNKVVPVLRWALMEMDERYKKLAAVGTRTITDYNKNPKVAQKMPTLVIMIDELADLMMTAPVDVEQCLCRLAQLGRATGIHLVVATQRPSVDVITGLIKANFPTRISFAVSSFVDSRTIIDSGGAEKLLGKGDMLYLAQDSPKPRRLQGVFVSDREIERLVRVWNSQPIPPTLQTLPPEVLIPPEELVDDEAKEDPLLSEARDLAQQFSRVSASLLQRRLRIGYPRAARLMELLAEEGAVDGAHEDKVQLPSISGVPAPKDEGKS